MIQMNANAYFQLEKKIKISHKMSANVICSLYKYNK